MPELNPRRIQEVASRFRVEPGRRVKLARDFDPAMRLTAHPLPKRDLKQLLAEGVEFLAEYQARLAAQDTYGVVMVLQAMDAAGKDGTIKHVMSGVNPQGVEVHSFKAPSSEDLDHDYLWRYQRRLPQRGHIGIFNRSHYEEVLVVRVHPRILDGQKLPPSSRKGDIWKRRYREINDWEHYLHDQGFRFVKMFLNLSREEQRRRFLARIDVPEKHWKFSANDARERAYWDDYQKAFSDMLSETSTDWAPWHVVPADDKPFARVVAAAILADTLIAIDPRYPKVTAEQQAALAEAKIALEADAPEGAEPDPIEGQSAARDSARKAEKDARKAAKQARMGAAKQARMGAAKQARMGAEPAVTGDAEAAGLGPIGIAQEPADSDRRNGDQAYDPQAVERVSEPAES